MTIALTLTAETAMKRIADLVRMRRATLAVLTVVAAVVTGGCETSSTVSSGPSPVKCQVSLGSTTMMEAAGGSGSFAVTAQPECAWDASTSASWISGLSPASGQGNGNVTFRVAANDGASVRDGSIVVNGQQVAVSQRAPCRYALTPATQNASANGGDGSVNVATAAECAWAASTDVNWITLTPPLSGRGDGAVAFTIAVNSGELRTGSITIAGQRATVTQAAVTAACNATITPTNQSIGAAGGAGTPITVTTSSTCQWTAVSNVPWMAITSTPSDRGNGTVTFSVAANTGAARTGTLTIAGRVFTVSQAAAAAPPPACAYSITPASQNAPAAGATGTAAVSTTAACAWTATSNAAWITVTSGAAGTGNGSVAFTVAANTGAARSATLTIAGMPFTVTQAAAAPPPCTYSIAPLNQSVNANANTGTVAVTAGTACAWTATSNAPWLSVTSGATGTGNGSVGFSIAANPGAARTGTLTIAGQTFTVTQAAFVPPCMYSINPNNQNFAALGGSGTVAVTTAAGCTWTAASGAPWITVTSGASGAGNGSVVFSVAANVGIARTGTLTIAGQPFTVMQAAVIGPLAPAEP